MATILEPLIRKEVNVAQLQAAQAVGQHRTKMLPVIERLNALIGAAHVLGHDGLIRSLTEIQQELLREQVRLALDLHDRLK